MTDPNTDATTDTDTNRATGVQAATAAPPVRSDLLALTEDSLAALANRGLVKRAVKELSAGTGATVLADSDGRLTATYPDGTTALLKAGSALAEAACTCAATGLCRHRIGLVLAYQRRHKGSALALNGPEHPERATAPAPGAQWSPGSIPDEVLERVHGTRSMQEARRSLATGYQASVHRPAPGRSPRVELPTCTVTFHVPDDPAYATTDAVEQKRGEAVALAVWAFRAADAQGLDAASAHVNVGGRRATQSGAAASADVSADASADPATGSSSSPSSASAPSPSSAAGAALAHAADLVAALLLDGVSTSGPLPIANLRRSAGDLASNSLLWPAAVAEGLVEQLEWYGQRNARHELARFADLAAEFLGRTRAAAAPAAHPSLPSPAQILGTGESARTPLRRVRLIGLGCRILGGPQHSTAELYFAQPHDGTVLVLRREWKIEETEQPPDNSRLRTRRIAGSPLHMLAACNLVSEAATRSASRTVELGASRIAKTTVTALGESWHQLPDSVNVRDYAALAAKLGDRHPRYLRPRVEAEDVYVLTVTEVRWVGYDPATQCLNAAVRDEHGVTARVRAPFRNTSPGALDALGAVLVAAADAAANAAAPARKPLMISGKVAAHSGELVVDPIAVWHGTESPIVPDLAAGDDGASLPAAGPAERARSRSSADQDSATGLLRTAVDLLAEHAHRGIDRVGDTADKQAPITQAAARLSRAGFQASAALFTDYGEALRSDDRAARVRTWADAFIALTVCLESNT